MEEILHQFERNVPPMICKVYHVLYLLSISGGLGMGFHKTIQHLDNFFGTAGWILENPMAPNTGVEFGRSNRFPVSTGTHHLSRDKDGCTPNKCTHGIFCVL